MKPGDKVALKSKKIIESMYPSLYLDKRSKICMQYLEITGAWNKILTIKFCGLLLPTKEKIVWTEEYLSQWIIEDCLEPMDNNLKLHKLKQIGLV